MPYFPDAAGVASQSLSVAEPASSDVVWDFVRFSFEIEEVSAAVFLKEKEKVSGVLNDCARGSLSG